MTVNSLHLGMTQSSQTISYRLQAYDYQQALKLARKARCKSVHEYSRLALLALLDEESTEDKSQALQKELAELRTESATLKDEVAQLRLTLAKTLQIMLTLNGYDAAHAEDFIRQNILDIANH